MYAGMVPTLLHSNRYYIAYWFSKWLKSELSVAKRSTVACMHGLPRPLPIEATSDLQLP